MENIYEISENAFYKTKQSLIDRGKIQKSRGKLSPVNPDVWQILSWWFGGQKTAKEKFFKLEIGRRGSKTHLTIEDLVKLNYVRLLNK